ncbi:hypothetical protein LCI18_013710 [Fusarium solani-melongenae]|uniref:Uncharacterized protein n=1 Tax=Fusarium solani subsp. cucurbitae TaxID=2747967 RepID=A0ACD3ZNU8_FUSSC|nr:hypothetical protein LCI18_013710 [Fusarium solani-melongenae]
MSNPAPNAGDTSPLTVERPNSDETITPTTTTTEDSAQLGAPSAPRRYALPTDWGQDKEKIRQLYLVEDKTLAKVMEIMARDHGHNGRHTQSGPVIGFFFFVSDIELADDCLLQATDVEMPNAEAEGAVDQPANDAGYADDQLFQPAGPGFAVDSSFQPADASCGGIDYLFQALNGQHPQAAATSRTTQHLFTAEAHRAVQEFFIADDQAANENTTHQASTDNEGDWQLSLYPRQSLV